MNESPEAIPVAEPIPAAEAIPETPPKPDSVRGRDLLAGVAIIWSFEIVIGVAVAASTGFSNKDFSPIVLFVSTLLSVAVALVVSWIFVCKKYHKSLLDGFKLRRVSTGSIVLSVVIGLAGAVVASILMT